VAALYAGPQGRASAAHLKDFRGILQADGYAGFEAAVRGRRDHRGGLLGARAQEVLRPRAGRPLADRGRGGATASAHSTRSRQEIRGKPPHERRTERKARAGPLLDEMKTWLETTLTKVATQEALATAIRTR
jgi:transposase